MLLILTLSWLSIYHYVPKREYFSSYRVGNFGNVKMGNKKVAHINEIGDMYSDQNYWHSCSEECETRSGVVPESNLD